VNISIRRGWLFCAAAVAVACTGFGASAAGTFYVVQGGTGAGTAWADAFGSIQDAVTAATAAGGGEVWVKTGTYSSATLDPVVTMASGVAIYGGFAGTETARDARDWVKNLTVITGDGNGDAIGDRRCILGANNATLDGFSLTKGYGASGGAMSNTASPTVANCILYGNRTDGDGGAVHSTAGSPVFTNCVFRDNTAGFDGGAINLTAVGSSPVFTNCTFTGNTATYNGGAVANFGDVTPTFTNCTFTGNSASADGGAMFNGYVTAPVLVNCILWNDSSELHNQDGDMFAGSVSYSCIQGGFAGTGNISADPLFVDGTVSDGDGYDLFLTQGSPCVDAGTAVGAPAADMRGIARPAGAGVDMGVYEHRYGIRYVRVGGTGDGTSWASACGSIQNAIDSVDIGEVWVAAGTYAATVDPGVAMRPYVGLYGGFAGAETARDDRDWNANRTILDGADTYRCVTGASDATLDGFTIQNGTSTRGGGMYNKSCSGITISNCVFTENTATQYGGGLFSDAGSLVLNACSFYNNSGRTSALVLYQASATVSDCSFTENAAINMGCCFNSSANTTMTRCTFERNSSTARTPCLYLTGSLNATDCTFTDNSGSNGSAVYTSAGSHTFQRCSFIGNSASYEGGAVYASTTASGTFIDCVFSGNSASSGGAAAVYEYDHTASLAFANCVFTGNHAATEGAALYTSYCFLSACNCAFAGNTSGWDGTVSATSYQGSAAIQNSILWDNATPTSGPVTITNSCVRGGFSGAGNMGYDPLFVDGADDGDGYDLRLQGGSPCINMGADTSATAPATATDMVGVPRPQGPAYDMGAYEFVPAPVAAFSASPTSGTVPLAVTFADASTSGVVPVTEWAWDFGDGGVSTEQNPVHTYTAAGVYAVALTASSVSGDKTLVKLHYVTVGRGTPDVTQWPTADDLIYGQALHEATMAGGLCANVPGVFAYVQPDVKPAAGTYSAAVTFTPADSVNYTTATGLADVTVIPAVPTITAPPVATAIALGQRLSASLLVGGQALAGATPVAGSFAFTQPLTLPQVSGPYPAAVTFTPADAANYQSAETVVSVLVESGGCPDCVETTGPYDVGGNACLIVPGTLPAETSFTWSREDGAPLDVSRFSGIFCRRLQITGLIASDAGTYVCTYDDGVNVDLYSVTIVMNPASPVPALPRGGMRMAVIGLIALVITWRYRQLVRV